MKKFYPNYTGQSTLADAKTRLNIHDICEHLNLPCDSRKNPCRSPWREDNHPSFSVNAAGTMFNDFATGEAGDQVTFFQKATGLSKADACRKFIELSGGSYTLPPRPSCPRPPFPPGEQKPKPVLPDFAMGTPEDIQHLASLRKIGREGLEWASERGLLRFATLRGFPAWVVTDGERVNAQARPMNGQTWDHLEGCPKAYTLPGSSASWPIGIREAQPFPSIALCEGAPDLLAAHYLALLEQATHHSKRDVKCAPVAMLGATLKIHPEALQLFAGKRVRIFGHDDESGRSAVERWAAQLASVGADVDAFSFEGLTQIDGKPVKDLNDAILMDAASLTQAERIMPL